MTNNTEKKQQKATTPQHLEMEIKHLLLKMVRKSNNCKFDKQQHHNYYPSQRSKSKLPRSRTYSTVSKQF